MAGRRPSRKGKETAAEASGSRHPMAGDQDNPPIMITEQGCTLVVESNRIPETPLQRAVCQSRHCVALNKTLEDAYNMHNTLIQCDHPNILNPIGVWTDPSDARKAYIAVTSVDTALNCLAKEQLFCVEGGFLQGFTALGFSVFRAIFDAIQYVNSRYEGGATSSTSNSPPIPLFPMMLEPKNIFVKMVNGQAQVMLGNFKTKLSDMYVRRNRRGRQDITREDVENAHWKEVGLSLKTLFGSSTDYVASRELTELTDFLTGGAVTYETLLWQPGIWDARTKIQFIREIYFLLDMERTSQTSSFESTPRGKILRSKSSLGLLPIMKLFSPPLDANNQEKPIKEKHLVDSVIFLRNKVLAHFDEEYPKLNDSTKNEIGTSIVTRERFIQKRKDDYMIKLARTIKELGWVSESPVMRGENDYMTGFSKLMIGGNAK